MQVYKLAHCAFASRKASAQMTMDKSVQRHFAIKLMDQHASREAAFDTCVLHLFYREINYFGSDILSGDFFDPPSRVCRELCLNLDGQLSLLSSPCPCAHVFLSLIFRSV
jgi:hypothetical protein